MDVKSPPTFHQPSTMEPRTSKPVKAAASTAAQHETTISTTAASPLQDIAFGSIAGFFGKVVEYPFDTIKVRLQSQPDHLPLRYTGPLDCFRQSISQDGIRSLYRGVSAPLAGAAAETASLFWSYGIAKDLIRYTLYPTTSHNQDETLPLSAMIAAGAASGGVTSLILTPIELVKCRMQAPIAPSSSITASHSTHQLSPLTVIRDVFRREGLPGFWRGQLGTFFRETGGTAAWFGAYEASTLYLKTRLHRQRQDQSSSQSSTTAQTPSIAETSLPIPQQMLAGALAGMSYNFLFFPADTIKSKIQTGELAPSTSASSSSSTAASTSTTFWSVGKDLWRVHGLKGLYRGCGITVLRSAPSSALIFTVVENLKGWAAKPSPTS